MDSTLTSLQLVKLALDKEIIYVVISPFTNGVIFEDMFKFHERVAAHISPKIKIFLFNTLVLGKFLFQQDLYSFSYVCYKIQ